MEKLNEIVIDYLKVKDTDYALMINGKWGCGKTYYLERDFKDFIKKKNSDNAKFSVALISLYGVSSPEDLLEFGISLELFAY